jgi:hypothetical protein
MTEYFTQGPPPVIPEVPNVLLLPLLAVIMLGAAAQMRRRIALPGVGEVS